ncbi:MAG: MlaA family lipoprotein [Vibrionaceae bacterium]
MAKRVVLVLSVMLITGCAGRVQPHTAAKNPPSSVQEIVTDARLLREKQNESFKKGRGEEQSAQTGEKKQSDPLEGFNRAMWALNFKVLDPYLLRPVSLAYVNYTPRFIRKGISNVFSNLEEPFSMVNSLLILDGKGALSHFNRFWINSTFGVAGLVDVAAMAHEPKQADRQFGDVLGHYGVGHGLYVMTPVYGPVTVREMVGDIVDDLYPPLSLVVFPYNLIKWFFQGLESRAELVAQEGQLYNSRDPYAFTRDVYLQNKTFRANLGKEQQPQTLDDSDINQALLDEVDG